MGAANTRGERARVNSLSERQLLCDDPACVSDHVVKCRRFQVIDVALWLVKSGTWVVSDPQSADSSPDLPQVHEGHVPDGRGVPGRWRPCPSGHGSADRNDREPPFPQSLREAGAGRGHRGTKSGPGLGKGGTAMAGTADVAVIGGSAFYSDVRQRRGPPGRHAVRDAQRRAAHRRGGGRQQHLLARVSRAAWRLDQAERERRLALAAAHTEGISIRTLATVAGLSASRVHQLVAAADLDTLERREGGRRRWPTQGEQRPGQPYRRCSPRPGTAIR